jgi:hypothetical protein
MITMDPRATIPVGDRSRCGRGHIDFIAAAIWGRMDIDETLTRKPRRRKPITQMSLTLPGHWRVAQSGTRPAS